MSSSASLLSDSTPPEMAAFAARIRQNLPGWHEIEWLSATGSTNADMLLKLRSALADWRGPLLRGAEEQSAGRGRAGRSWRTNPGDALLFSCGLRTNLPQSAMPPLSIVAGVAACEALNRLLPQGAGQKVSVKWPNDLQWGEAKLAGILPETVALPPAQRTALDQVGLVIGIGLNLRGAAALSTHLGRAVADWAITGGNADAALLVAHIAQAWQAAIELYSKQGFSGFVRRYAECDALAGQMVRVLDNDRVLFEGIAQGVDAGGRLQVSTTDGLRAVTVGDVSVRGTAGGMP